VPIYQYRCEACDERFEELQRASAKPPPCPSCHAHKAVRVYSTFGTRWKPSAVNWHRLG
jgi:putative FmdB family regulatory protein